ncbi:phosphonate ABC transporter, permease protein PhnE [Corynebacterium glutamicum]|uniref:phosphonate ABC transporter, permease protein PhnE n=1 Tax=Corynebacterium glutamicum TaxID=1718 RepID=UPI00117CF5BB|nr:phosphonate ABC transporter, permease protein PhnE [Corynebacterium glutamicum]QDQ21477.1 phosphonate ABC transporter, permease protein PhnE [Corynebacterium glutamicum]QDQ22516.1 phosphonate ABC transporter, permease protein PhnE [Corynebacterium glutamicum]
MSIATPVKAPVEPIKKKTSLESIIAGVVLVALLVGGIWSVNSLGINIGTIINSFENASAFAGRMFPLDFPPVMETLGLIFETLAIVFLSTLLSVVLSIPTALLAARNTTMNKGAQWTSRAFIVLCRAVPDLVLAIIFLRMFGLGATAGIIAMGIHSVGMVAKLYADAIEELDDGARESIESAGGTRSQQILTAIPQVLMPQLIATALHRFDINLRTSVLLGYVGVGGIGLAIADSLRVLDYQRGMALAFIVLALCIVIELISGSIRAALMSNASGGITGGTWVDRMFNKNREVGVNDLKLTPPWSMERFNRFGAYLLIAVLTIVSFWRVDVSLRELFTGLMDLPETLALFFPPSTGGSLSNMLEQLVITLQISLAATLIGGIIAIPIGIFAARNVVANKFVYQTFRVIIVIVRGIPELILAIIFVVISGLGGVAGTLALSVGAIGLLSKLIADSLEETDTKVQDALRAAGASEMQIFFSATVRQAAPAFVAHTMYLLDTNIRSATLLGVVGAGGVGFLLLNASRINQFDVVMMVLILMVAVVLIVEALSMWLRKVVR